MMPPPEAVICGWYRFGGVMDDVTKVRQENVSSAVYGRIRADILCGSLAPGMKLKLENLRQTYDVSINTLRETLSRLAADRSRGGGRPARLHRHPGVLLGPPRHHRDKAAARMPRRPPVARPRRSRMGIPPRRRLSQALESRGPGGRGSGPGMPTSLRSITATSIWRWSRAAIRAGFCISTA